VTESRCIELEALARVRDLPAGSPERRHVEECPRCRAALLALAEFEREAGGLPAEADAPGANARLSAVIDSLTSAAPVAAAPKRTEPGWLHRLFAPPAMRYATGFAVVAIVAASAWIVARGPAGNEERLQRGVTGPDGAASIRATESGWEIAWPAVEGAESYDVVFLSPDLREVARVPDLHAAPLVLRRDALPSGVTPGASLLVEIDARSGGVTLEMTVPVAIELK
jgi:hypothetical protein